MAYRAGTRPVLWVTAIIAALFGAALAGGGAWLIALGGSWYYLLAGAALLVTALLLLRRRPAALWVHAGLVVATLAWALYEVGLDWWALAPRGGVLVLFGLWLLTPWVTRALVPRFADRPPSAWRGGGLALTLSMLVAGGAGVAAMLQDPHDLAGRLAMAPVSAAAPTGAGAEIPAGEWHAYGRTDFGQRYSPLAQITPANVGNLEKVWEYHTGDEKQPEDTEETTFQVTPLKIGDTLYLCTPHNIAIALDAATGEERWRFDPGIGPSTSRQHQTCRGVSYLDTTAAGAAPSDAPAPAAGGATACPRRIYLPTADARLIALDADSGDICPGFGTDGTVDLSANMPNWEGGFYYSTSPPVVAGGLVVVGGAVNDNVSTTLPSGVIRAYDALSGELVWNWDSGNPDATQPIAEGETYTQNSPNAWSIMSADEELGLLYAPLGTASPDQFGGNRSDAVERFSSSVVALDLASGEVAWSFQAVHHDIWDYDVPAQPTLVDLDIGGETVPALVQPTKQGEIFVLDRRSGEPLLPVQEVPVPQGAAEGDFTAPTQPVSALSFKPPPLAGSDMWGATMFDQLACRILFRGLRYEGRFTPPSLQGTLHYPGNFGVFNWGGVAVDPVRQILFATPGYLAFTVRLVPRTGDEAFLVSEGEPGINENFGAPYAVEIAPFTSPIGLPCQAPPWGYVAGADLSTGEIAWMHRNGTVRDRSPLPLPLEMGVPDLGGPLLTAGGVAFMSGTLDYYVRAYAVETGAQLWEARLPAGGQATPMSYEQDGRQFVLVVAGGHGSLGTKTGDAVIAYALPDA